MPRYYFHVHNHVIAPDEEGLELPGPNDAREEAMEAARELASASIREFGNVNLDHYIRVTDESGAELLAVTFRDAFTITG